MPFPRNKQPLHLYPSSIVDTRVSLLNSRKINVNVCLMILVLVKMSNFYLEFLMEVRKMAIFQKHQTKKQRIQFKYQFQATQNCCQVSTIRNRRYNSNGKILCRKILIPKNPQVRQFFRKETYPTSSMRAQV